MSGRPLAYLVVVLPLLFLGVLVMVCLLTLYAQVKGIPLSAVPDLNGALITIPAFILWVPLALQLGNVVLRTIPTLRAIAENYAARANRPGFAQSQTQLMQLTMWLGGICVPLIALGFWL